MEIILYFVAFLFGCGTFVFLNAVSTALGVKNGLWLFYAEFMPTFLATLEKLRAEDLDNEDMQQVLQDEEDGVLTEEQAKIILRNMRGEGK